MRINLGLSQRELASELLVAPSSVAQWESNTHAVPGPVVRLLELYEERLGMTAAPRPPRVTAIDDEPFASLRDDLITDRGDGALLTRARAIAVRQITSLVGRARGPLLMKLAQWISQFDYGATEDDHLLARHDGNHRAMTATQVVAMFCDELAAPPDQLFKEWDPHPMAIGSVGQVHRAMLADGRAVAVKVQRPVATAMLERELGVAELVTGLLTILFPGSDRARMLDEIRVRAVEECDFTLEAARQREVSALFVDHPGIRIPDVVDHLSTRRVLTMELIDGVHLHHFVATATQKERDALGTLLFRFLLQPPVCEGIHHGDIHPRNFLVANGTLGVVDFGRVTRWPPQFAAAFRDHLRAVMERDPRALLAALEKMRVIADHDRYHVDVALQFLAGVHSAWLCDGRFHFTASHMRHWRRLLSNDNPNRAALRLVPELMLLTHLHAMASLLVRVGGRVDGHAMMSQWLYPHGGAPPPYTVEELRVIGAT